MTFSFSLVRALRASICSLAVLSLVSCAMVESALPAGLADTIGQVTGLSDSVAGWKSSLSGALDNTGLGKLQGFVDQAGELGNSLNSMKEGLSSAMANPVGAMTNKLQEMSGLDVDGLNNLAPKEQMTEVDGFADSAGSLGEMASDFMNKFGG